MALTESKMRDFIKQIIILSEDNAQELINNGYNPEERLGALKTKSQNVYQTEMRQTMARVELKNATKESREALTSAYTDASAFVEILTGILGKRHSLILQIRKMRF